ncbi:MAG: tRNA-intron lyase [Candidatus Micrarchaeota archaeon]|nr:tRNA-intron lyase [Candidatus Micrarchaeota archaeon]
MTLQIYFNKKARLFYSDDPYTISVLRRAYYGKMHKSVLYLDIIEVFYLYEMRKAIIKDESTFQELDAQELLFLTTNKQKFFTNYYAYRDWRERGLIINNYRCFETTNKQLQVEYPESKEIILPKEKLKGTFYAQDCMTICEKNELSEYLYYNYWFGQIGSYKNSQRGSFLKLDSFETLYLFQKNVLTISNIKEKELNDKLSKRIRDFKVLYDVYSEWRRLGYVIKTGFKFGTHFRVYLPDAKPIDSESNYFHSSHVLHCIPEHSSIDISELSRAIRVAHSVRKTFILAIPLGQQKKVAGKSIENVEKVNLTFYAYTRSENVASNKLLNNSEREEYLYYAFHEDDSVDGHKLESLISDAREQNTNLIIGIVDRETGVTYYLVKKLLLKGSKISYYELEWIQP